MSDRAELPVVCPHCEEKMPQITWTMLSPVAVTPNGLPMVFFVFYCPKCQKALNCQLSPMGHVLTPEQIAAQLRQAGRPQG